MIAPLVAWSARHHRTVIAAALLAAAAGELARRAVSRDVFPDLADPQIVLVADWMGHPATEVATAVTQVLTGALEGLPGSTAIRGSSMAGMAYVDVLFGSAESLESGRQAIVERVAGVRGRLPGNARVQVGPLASSTGWVFQYLLADPTRGESLVALRRFQDDVLRPALASIPGVAEVASVGGDLEQIVVSVRSDELRERGLAFSDVVQSLRSALSAADAVGFRALPALPILVPAATGKPVQLRDVAQVRITHEMPTGLADLSGVLPAVGGIVVARRDADLSPLLLRVERTLEAHRSRLHGGAQILTVYDRSDLIGRIQRTLLRALGEEVGVVALVILIFLLHARSALVPLATLPLVVLLTFAAMWILGVPATVMSLGGIGIALGLAVDADVVALEACHRRLEPLGAGGSAEERRARIVAAAGSFGPAILTSLLIAALSFLPVLAFAGETGRLLRPLVLTKTLVIASAALVALTLAPALRDRLLRSPVRPEFDNRLTRALVRVYRPFVHFALTRPTLTLLVAGLALVSCAPIASRLGGEFLPRIDEGDLLYMPTTLPGAPVEELTGQLRRQDQALARAREVATVFGKVGRADTATDPAPLSMAETTIRLRPRNQWPTIPRQRWYSPWAPPLLRRALGHLWPEETPATPAELLEKLDRAARAPGWTGAWTAPVRARMDMMATGVRTPVGIRIVAADPARLEELGVGLRAIALRVAGVRSAVFESLGGETRLRFVPDPGALAAHGVDPALARATADLLLAGGQIGELASGGRPLRILVTPDLHAQGPADQLREATVRASGPGPGQPIPLALLGRPRYAVEPATIRTEGRELVAYVHVDLDQGADLLGAVDGAKRELERSLSAQEIRLRPGERVEWAGQYPLLVAGARRLQWIVPLVLLSMLGLLFLQFRSLTEALIVLVSVPFALVGSIWTLYWLGYSLSAPVWVGLLSVAGLAMQTGVVMVVYIDEAFYRRLGEGRLASREDIVAAHAEGTVRRLRPKVMTIATMGASLLPLLWTQGGGAEVMKRVAAPMIGGLATSAFLTLEVLPVLYTIWRHRQLLRARRLHLDLATIVGTVPSWARR
jgi:Cu(I)/Ag(I) efflux system membrane protein CusA/SilA